MVDQIRGMKVFVAGNLDQEDCLQIKDTVERSLKMDQYCKFFGQLEG